MKSTEYSNKLTRKQSNVPGALLKGMLCLYACAMCIMAIVTVSQKDTGGLHSTNRALAI